MEGSRAGRRESEAGDGGANSGCVIKQMSTVGNWGSVLLGTSRRLHGTGASEILIYLGAGEGDKGYGQSLSVDWGMDHRKVSSPTGRIKVTRWGSSFGLCQPTAGPRRFWRREGTSKQKMEGVCRHGDHEC